MRVCYNFATEAFMNTVPSYLNADWLKPISYNFLIWEEITQFDVQMQVCNCFFCFLQTKLPNGM